jgi:hypothetical protein
MLDLAVCGGGFNAAPANRREIVSEKGAPADGRNTWGFVGQKCGTCESVVETVGVGGDGRRGRERGFTMMLLRLRFKILVFRLAKT